MSSWFSYIRSSIIGGDQLPSTSSSAAGDQIGPLPAGDDTLSQRGDTLSQNVEFVDNLSQRDDILSSCSIAVLAEQKRPADDAARDQQCDDSLLATTSHHHSNNNNNNNNALPTLSQKQREHIKNVLLRAERSGRNAKVVMDSRHLKRGRLSSMAPAVTTTTTASTVAVAKANRNEQPKEQHQQQKQEYDGMGNDENGEEQQQGQFIVQMDSLPEDLEVSVGPYSYCSYASSELSYSEADKGYSSAVTEEPDGGAPAGDKANKNATAAGEQAEDGEDGQKSIAQKMRKLSRKIDQWLKSLDKEDSEFELLLNKTATGDYAKKGTVQHSKAYVAAETVQQHEEQPILLNYLDTLAQSICVIAVEQSANKMLECQIEWFDHFADGFATGVIESVIQFADEELLSNQNDDVATHHDSEVVVQQQHLFEDVLGEDIENVEMDVPVITITVENVPLSKPISMDEEDEGEHRCYTILVEEQQRRRTEEEALALMAQMPSMASPSAAKFDDGNGTDSNAIESDERHQNCFAAAESVQLASVESVSISGADSDIKVPKDDNEEAVSGSTSEADSNSEAHSEVEDHQMKDGLTKADLTAYLDKPKDEIVSKQKNEVDVVPREEPSAILPQKVLDIMPKDKDNSGSTSEADSTPETEPDHGSPVEEQLLHYGDKQKEDVWPKTEMDIRPKDDNNEDGIFGLTSEADASYEHKAAASHAENFCIEVKAHHNLSTPKETESKEEFFLDILSAKELDIVSNDDKKKEAVSGSISEADTKPETESDVGSLEQQSMEGMPRTDHHYLDERTQDDTQEMDIVPKKEPNIMPKDYDENGTSGSTSDADSSSTASQKDVRHNGAQKGQRIMEIMPKDELDILAKDDLKASSSSGTTSDADSISVISPVEGPMKMEELAKDNHNKMATDIMPKRDFLLENMPTKTQSVNEEAEAMSSSCSISTSSADSIENDEENTDAIKKENEETNADQTTLAQNDQEKEGTEKNAMEFDWIKKMVEENELMKEKKMNESKEEDEAIKKEEASEEGQIERTRQSHFEEAKKMPKSFDSFASTITSGADETFHALSSEIGEEEIGEQKMPMLTEDEMAQIEAVQRRAEEQPVPLLTREELAQIEAVQRRAEKQPVPLLKSCN